MAPAKKEDPTANNRRGQAFWNIGPGLLVAITVAAIGVVGAPKCTDIQTVSAANVQIGDLRDERKTALQAHTHQNDNEHGRIYTELRAQREEIKQLLLRILERGRDNHR